MKRAALLVLALLVAAGAAVAVTGRSLPDPKVSPAIATRTPDPRHGAYVAVLGDCAACHSVPGSPDLAGGLALPTPAGPVWSSNITPDKVHGIGVYSFTDFARLMRQGVRPNGERVLPAMPYTAYAKVSDEDLHDLYAYLMQAVPAAPTANHADGVLWFARWPIGLWNKAFHDDSRFAADPAKGASWNRGAYLVQGLAHCGTCHTPRGPAFQEKALDGRSDLFLSGARLDGASPINLRGNTADGLGRWSADDIAELLASGRSAHSAVVGQMGEVVAHSTQFMTDADRGAIAAYLKSLSPAPESGRATFAATAASLDAVMSGKQTDPGALRFMNSCSACHRLNGDGAGRALPSLAGNPTVLAQHPDTLIAVILKGARMPSTAAAPSPMAMPPFGWRYDDREVAEVASYVRQSWGNGAPSVSAGQVRAVRRALGLATPGR